MIQNSGGYERSKWDEMCGFRYFIHCVEVSSDDHIWRGPCYVGGLLELSTGIYVDCSHLEGSPSDTPPDTDWWFVGKDEM